MNEINTNIERKMYDYVDLIIRCNYNNRLEEILLEEGYNKIVDNHYFKDGISIFSEKVENERLFSLILNLLNANLYDANQYDTHIYVQAETENLGHQADTMLRKYIRDDNKDFHAMRYLWRKK